MQKRKEICITEVHGGGGLELVKPAPEPVSSRPKPCASLKKRPRSLPLSPLVVDPRRKKTDGDQK